MTDPVRVRLAALRAQMAERGIDIYVVPTADFHGSEYVGEYFKAREYMDRWQIFYTGGKTARRKWRDTVPYG